jgi:hypothetical protein
MGSDDKPDAIAPGRFADAVSQFRGTKPTRTPTSIAGRALRGALDWIDRAELAKQSQPGPEPPRPLLRCQGGSRFGGFAFGETKPLRPPPRPAFDAHALAKFTKRTNLRNPNEINDTGSVRERSRTPLWRNGPNCSRPNPAFRHFGETAKRTNLAFLSEISALPSKTLAPRAGEVVPIPISGDVGWPRANRTCEGGAWPS